MLFSAVSTLEAVVERQRKKATALKAREVTRANPTEKQNIEPIRSEEQNTEIPLRDPPKEPIVEPVSSEEVLEETHDMML